MDKPEEEMTPHELKQKKARTIFQQMQETIRANRTKFLSKIGQKEVKQKMYGKATFDLDASIEAEAAKTIPKIKLPPIHELGIHRPLEVLGDLIDEEPEEEIIEETVVESKPETVEEKSDQAENVFLPPDHANTNMDDLMNALDIVAKYLGNAKNEVMFLDDSIHNTDFETSDFLHSIELSEFDSQEKIDVFNKVCEIRKRRRSYKYRLEYMRELDMFVTNNVNIVNKIDALRGQLRRIKEKQDTARYYSRVRTDIKEDAHVHIGKRATI